MSRAMSAYLDLVRFLAAVAVFVGHLSVDALTGGAVWWRLGAYGAAAVAMFFVLSGYVIAFVVDTREKTAGAYVTNRIARLYSVVLIALIVTLACDTVGMALNPDLYGKVMSKPPELVSYVASLFFIQEFLALGLGGAAPGTNSPFWSLSFEAAYYALAGLILFAPRWLSVPASLVLMATAGNTITALFPVWLLGFLVFHYRAKLAMPRAFALVLFVCSAMAMLIMPFVTWRLGSGHFDLSFPWGRGPFNRQIVYDYVVGVACAVNIVAARALLTDDVALNDTAASIARWLGSLTFPLYCLHFPILCLLAAISPFNLASWPNVFLLVVVPLAMTAWLTPKCDWWKVKIRDALQRPRLASRPG